MPLSPARELRTLLDSKPGGSPVVAPGADTPFTAKLIERAGFDAVYVTGMGTAATLFGLPDVGLLGMTEMLFNAGNIARATTIPVIADADNGYGNAVNAMRTVRAYEREGIAAIQLEDQPFPKRCGHMDGKELVSETEMVGKIKAAVASRTDEDTIIVARTDARAVTGLDDALRRAEAYAAAGADIVFPEALADEAEFERAAAELSGVPLIANMTEWGKSPMLSVDELGRLGFCIVIFPAAAMRAAQKAIVDMLAELREKGTQREALGRMLHRHELYEVVDLAQAQEDERRYVTEAGETVR